MSAHGIDFPFDAANRFAGWLCVQMRPNLGIASGGAFLYGPGAWLPWEVPHYAYFDYQIMPDPLDSSVGDVPQRCVLRDA